MALVPHKGLVALQAQGLVLQNLHPSVLVRFVRKIQGGEKLLCTDITITVRIANCYYRIWNQMFILKVNVNMLFRNKISKCVHLKVM